MIHLKSSSSSSNNRVTSTESTPSLASINGHYGKVLHALYENCCSMANAFCLAGCLHSTVRDFMAIAELKIIDTLELDLVIGDHPGSVKELEITCRRRLRRHLPAMVNMSRAGQLLPFKFDDRCYE